MVGAGICEKKSLQKLCEKQIGKIITGRFLCLCSFPVTIQAHEGNPGKLPRLKTQLMAKNEANRTINPSTKILRRLPEENQDAAPFSSACMFYLKIFSYSP